MSEIIIRDARPRDAARMLEIYAYYVERTAVSFEYEPPSLEVFMGRIAAVQARFPWLALERDGIVEGYAYAAPYHPRAAFGWCCETTVYLAPDCRRQGCGRRLYEALEAALKAMGIQNLYALVACPDPPDQYLSTDSADFHARMGYVQAGRLRRCGYKFGRWYDMLYLEKQIGGHPSPIAPVLTYSAALKA